MQEIKSRGLTRDAIKMIAMLTMFFNHFSHVFLTAGTYPAEFLKGIGYFTAPVMCYFLVEGFYKTSSKRAYAKRLFVFALVSQVPYFLAFNREAAVLNMMFSLLFSFLILCVFHGEAFRRGKGAAADRRAVFFYRYFQTGLRSPRRLRCCLTGRGRNGKNCRKPFCS